MGFYVVAWPAGTEPTLEEIRFSQTFRLQPNAEREAEACRAAGFDADVLEGRAPRLARVALRRVSA